MGYIKQEKEDDDALITIRLGGLSILGVVFVILKVYGDDVCWFERWAGLCEEILGNVRCLMCLMWGAEVWLCE